MAEIGALQFEKAITRILQKEEAAIKQGVCSLLFKQNYGKNGTLILT